MDSLSELFKGSFMLKLLAAIIAILFSMDIDAQVSQDSELHKTLKSYDNILFEEVYNKCKIEKIEVEESISYNHQPIKN